MFAQKYPIDSGTARRIGTIVPDDRHIVVPSVRTERYGNKFASRRMQRNDAEELAAGGVSSQVIRSMSEALFSARHCYWHLQNALRVILGIDCAAATSKVVRVLVRPSKQNEVVSRTVVRLLPYTDSSRTTRLRFVPRRKRTQNAMIAHMDRSDAFDPRVR